MQAARRLLDARVPMIKFPKRRTDSGERQSPSRHETNPSLLRAQVECVMWMYEVVLLVCVRSLLSTAPNYKNKINAFCILGAMCLSLTRVVSLLLCFYSL